MKKIIPVFFVSMVLLLLGIVLSILWGAKGGAYLSPNSNLDFRAGVSLLNDLDYFREDLVRRSASGMGNVLLQVLVIFFTVLLTGWFFKRIGQPAVVGYIFAGILLGPSFFGNFFPGAFAFVFKPEQETALRILGEFGVMIFMFLAGMEMDFKLLRNQTNSVVMVSHVGILFPFFLGVQAASLIYRGYGEGVHFTSFALMMGIGMSITAFPVLVRMLQESGLIKTPVGQLALSAAAVDDLTAWFLLSVIIAVISFSSVLLAVWSMIALGLFLLIMFFLVKPFLKFAYEKWKPSQSLAAAILLYLLFFSAAATKIIGIHAVFGAFAAGVIAPKDAQLTEYLTKKLEYFCVIFLLPIFFVISGLRTHLELIQLRDIPAVLLLVGVAVVGKWGGVWAAGCIAGLRNKEAFLIGALMNTRGLMELIVLNIAYELGVFSAKVFSMMVVMAILTTAMTGPIIRFYQKKEALRA